MKITTEMKSTARGVTITAKGKGKQRTIPLDTDRTDDYNHGSAAGVLANVVLTDEQQAKMRHPSGRARWTFEGEGRTRVITLDV